MGDLLLQAKGQTLVLYPSDKAEPRPAATAPPSRVEVLWRYEDQPINTAQSLGRFTPGASGSFHFNQAVEKRIVISTRSFSADGVPDVDDLADAVTAMPIPPTEPAPEVGLIGEASPTQMTLGITGFTNKARKRKIRIADNPLMTNATVQEFATDDYVIRPLALYLDIFRGSLPATIWVGISHSSGEVYGPETILGPLTWGSSSGGFDPNPRDIYDY